MRSVETVLLLVVLGTVVAVFAGRLRVPAPSLLVVAGLLIGLLPGVPAVRVPPEAVSLVVLPPLLYAASEELPGRDVRAVWRPVIILAVGLVLASAAAVAAVAGAAAAVSASMALVLGAVLASTDPVTVSALGRRLSLPPRVQALVQAESLFNDATSLVLFQIAVSTAVAGTAGATAGGLKKIRPWSHASPEGLGRCESPGRWLAARPARSGQIIVPLSGRDCACSADGAGTAMEHGVTRPLAPWQVARPRAAGLGTCCGAMAPCSARSRPPSSLPLRRRAGPARW